MSNNNPHGHISQPTQNPAWNHLQLEHQMNSLLPPFVRGPSPFDSMDLSLQSSRNAGSPLNKAGHPPSMLQHEYGHKQVPPPPPTPHQQHPHQQSQQQQQQQATQIHTSNNYPIHNLSTNSPSNMSHAQQQQQQQSQSHHSQLGALSSPVSSQHSHSGMQGITSTATAPPPAASPAAAAAAPPAKYLNSNGNDCESMLPPPATAQSSASIGSNSSGGGGGNNNGAAVSAGPSPVHYMRDTNDSHMGDNYGKVSHMQHSYEAELQSKSAQKPVELVNKDCNYPTMMSNKMPPHHQPQQQQQHQISPKKQSPIRNYHGHQHHQQQQQSPYTNPPAGKHNGPHTPPTPQSPVLQLHGSNNMLDYNQLHLQQQSQGAYAHHQQQGSHQQQSHMQPQMQSQHPLHYAHPHAHHHHHLQQQQQQQQQQQHHAPPHMHAQLHQQQQQQQQQQHQPQASSQHQQVASHMHQQHPSPMHSAPPPPPHHANLTHLDEPYAMPDEVKQSTSHLERSAIADLSANSNTPSANFKPSTPSVCLPDSAESPSPDAVSSNAESLDSNSNSSSCRQRHKHSVHKMSSTPFNDSETEDLSAISQARAGAEQQQQLLGRRETGTSRSPKTSPEQQRRSPRKLEMKSPTGSSEATALQNAGLHERMNTSTTIGPHTPPTPTSVHEKAPLPAQSLENGRLTAAVSDDVESIDKISAMIAKTDGDANSNSSIKSDTELSGSPKTKKQRQALKLRSAEYNSNSNCSSNSFNNANVAANDNAVAAADELHKEAVQIGVVENAKAGHVDEAIEGKSEGAENMGAIATKSAVRALSPQSCSRSSSSSSSSSSCSNTSRSSSGSKAHRKKNQVDGPGTTSGDAVAAAGDGVEKENRREDSAQLHITNRDAVDGNTNIDSSKKPSTEPLNLNNKKETYFEEVENKLEEMFAGIEDEPASRGREDLAAKTPSHEVEGVGDLSLALELSSEDVAEQQRIVEHRKQNANNDTPTAIHVRTDGPPPTKAAKKSTLPSPIQATPIPPASPLSRMQATASPTTATATQGPVVDMLAKSAAGTVVPKRVTPPRRRLSVVMDPANLRITLDESAGREATKRSKASVKEHSKELIVCLDDELPSTSAAAAAAAALVVKSTEGIGMRKETANGGGSKATSPKKSRRRHVNACKRGMSQPKQESSKANGRTAGGRYGIKGAKSQHHQRRKQPNSSDDDATTPPTREGSNSNVTESKYKSPFILVKRDGSVSVINAPLATEDVNEKQTKAKKVNAVGYAHDRKNIRGLHSSTLSNKYDADTTDSTWICVFCKRGPHKFGLGDLFGPYLVSVDCEEYKTAIRAPDALDMDAVFVSKRRRMDMVQCNPRNLPVVPAMRQMQQQPQQMCGGTSLSPRAGMGKKKKKSTDALTPTPATTTAIATVVVDPLDCSADVTLQRTFAGMSKVSESSYEVWLHEDCIVWTPDVFLVGARVMGLDAAVWNSTRYQCVLCGKPGAIVCCLQRDCKAAAHVPCAREAHWSLNETNLKVHCQTHKTAAATATAAAATPAAKLFASLATALTIPKSTTAS